MHWNVCRLQFGRDHEADVWSRIWTWIFFFNVEDDVFVKILKQTFVKILKLNFGQDSKAEVLLDFETEFMSRFEVEFWCDLKAVTLVKQLNFRIRCAYGNVLTQRHFVMWSWIWS